jgi:hypothetical protein
VGKTKSKFRQDIHVEIDKDLYRFLKREKDRLNKVCKEGKHDQGTIVAKALRMYRDSVEGAGPTEILPRAS